MMGDGWGSAKTHAGIRSIAAALWTVSGVPRLTGRGCQGVDDACSGVLEAGGREEGERRGRGGSE